MKMKKILLSTLLIATSALSPQGWANQYELDPIHSSIIFKIKHLMSTVTGRFQEFEGEVHYDPNAETTENWKTKVQIKSKSLTTFHRERDRHLRSKDFFHTENFPTITFESTSIKKKKKGKLEMEGTLTIKGKTKTIHLHARDLGGITDPWGVQRHGFTATTTINRQDYGMRWNRTLDKGGVLLGDEVEIVLHLQVIPKKETPATDET